MEGNLRKFKYRFEVKWVLPRSVWSLILMRVASVVSLCLGRSTFFLVCNALFSLILFIVVSAGHSCLFVIIIWIFALILRQEVLWKTFFSLLRRENSFKLSDGLSNLRFVWGVVEKSAAEKSPILLQNAYSKVTILVAPVCWSTESCFKRETIYQVEFSPHYYSCCAFTGFLNHKITAWKAKILAILTK